MASHYLWSTPPAHTTTPQHWLLLLLSYPPCALSSSQPCWCSGEWDGAEPLDLCPWEEHVQGRVAGTSACSEHLFAWPHRCHKRGGYDVENEEKIKLGITVNHWGCQVLARWDPDWAWASDGVGGHLGALLVHAGWGHYVDPMLELGRSWRQFELGKAAGWIWPEPLGCPV